MKFLSKQSFSFSVFICMQLFGEQIPCSEIKKRILALQRPTSPISCVSQKWEDVQMLQKLYEEMEKEGISGKFREKHEIIQELQKLHPDNNRDHKQTQFSKLGTSLAVVGGVVAFYGINDTAKFFQSFLDASQDLYLEKTAPFFGGLVLMIIGQTIVGVKHDNADKELKKNIELTTAFIQAS